jgi:hypothetical protein
MNCAECRELLVCYIERLLDEQQSETVRQHLTDCAACRAQLQQTKALQNRLIADGCLIGQNDIENSVMDRIVREQAFQLRKANQVKQGVNVWRIIMKSPITKLAAAAVIIIAVLAGIYFITGKTPSVTCCAWAQIADKVEQLKTCVCSMRVKQTGGPQGTQDVKGTMYISSDYGNRMDTYADGNLAMQAFVLPSEKVIISVMPQAKKYMRMLLTDDYMAKMKKQGQDPRDMVRGFMSGEYSELGKSTIDGIEVKGIQTVNPPAVSGIYDNFVGKLWVDVTTELPVRLEFEAQVSVGAQKIQLSMVMDDFEWQSDLDPVVFEPNIPADYTLMAEMKMPGLDEASAVEGFRTFAEITDGNYPSLLNMTTLVQEVTEALMKKMNIAKGVKPTDEQTNELMQKMMKIQGIFMFYNDLAQTGKDPAYYGKDVSAGDVNAVLMRWKISEDTYRVVFGDLTAENVTADQLREMEQPPQQ